MEAAKYKCSKLLIKSTVKYIYIYMFIDLARICYNFRAKLIH